MAGRVLSSFSELSVKASLLGIGASEYIERLLTQEIPEYSNGPVVIDGYYCFVLENGNLLAVDASGNMCNECVFDEYGENLGSRARFSDIRRVVIPNGIRKIEQYTFFRHNTLEEIQIPASVTQIGNWVFHGCVNLASVTIPDGVTRIENHAFNGCIGLTSVTIPDSVTSIGDGVFEGCSGLTSVTIGNGVTSIGGYAFYNCSGLTSINIPSSVTSIGEEAFYYCNRLEIAIVPEHIYDFSKKCVFPYECNLITKPKSRIILHKDSR